MFVFMFESCMQWGFIVVIDIIARQYRASSGDGKVDFVVFSLCYVRVHVRVMHAVGVYCGN